MARWRSDIVIPRHDQRATELHLCKFKYVFHFRVAVTVYPYLQERVGVRDTGVVACRVSEVMNQVWTRKSLAQSCPIYGLCLAGPTAVETF